MAIYGKAGAGKSCWTNQGDPEPGDIVNFHNPEYHNGPHSVIFIGWNKNGMDCYSYDRHLGYRRHTYRINRSAIYNIFKPT